MSQVADKDPFAAHKEGVMAGPLGTPSERLPCPLESTYIAVKADRGLATVETKRVFRNNEKVAIEATLTFPVPIDAVLHDLMVEIDGRTLRAIAKTRDDARSSYETAIDTGKLAVLHEEVVRGIHMISVGQLAPGAACTVVSTWSTITTSLAGSRRLRIPTTVGEIYGRLPVNPADDLLVGADRAVAHIDVRAEDGTAAVLGADLRANGAILEGQVDLSHAIDIVLTGTRTGSIEGRTAEGRVTLDIGPAPTYERPLDLAILFDRSWSTDQPARSDGPDTVWSVMRDALATTLRGLPASDRVKLYEFHSVPTLVGQATGPEAARLAAALGGPTGGTEIGLALGFALDSGVKDVLLLTDGQSGALDVHGLAGCGARISALLVGADSLEAMVGHLAVLTGGHLACTSGFDAADHLKGLLAVLRKTPAARHRGRAAGLPDSISLIRGGSQITASCTKGDAGKTDPVGALVAAMALPFMTEPAATACAIANGLCTHLTSLVIVDDEGLIQDAIPETRKVPLPRPFSASYPLPAPAMPSAREAPRMPSAYEAQSISERASARPVAAPRPAAASPDVRYDVPACLLEEEESARTGTTATVASTRVPAREARRSFFTRFFARRRLGRDAEGPGFDVKGSDLRAAGLLIDWSRHADRLANGQLEDEDLPPVFRETILAAAKSPSIVKAAGGKAAGPTAIAIAAALAALAAQSHDRSAARLVRRVANGIGKIELDRLAAAFGLLAAAA